jgi:hypothetical protein
MLQNLQKIARNATIATLKKRAMFVWSLLVFDPQKNQSTLFVAVNVTSRKKVFVCSVAAISCF